VIDDAFTRLGLESLVSFTAAWNTRSRRVMEKIGMVHDAGGDFLHPAISPEHKLAPHVLYRIDRGEGGHRTGGRAPLIVTATSR
jgi:ribosomal-protein-alanine N-acetyltransferase